MKRNIRGLIPHYTYKQKNVEEKTLYRRLLFIGGLTIVLLLALWYWGTTFINILGFLGTDKNDNSSNIAFELPLRKPTIEDLPGFTNKETISISGSVNAGIKVKLLVNGASSGETTSDAGGNFTFVDVSLKDGLNLIKIIATDAFGESKDEKVLITFDNTKPQLEVTTPKSNQSFPAGTKSISVKGKTEPDAIVLVNSVQAITDPEGGFSYVLQVKSGQNKINIQSTDEAGNIANIKLTVLVE
ncbi:MAG: Ig-like domain-containing protein [Candidatus Woykebacteria bacterium]